MVATPKIATHTSIHHPARRVIGRSARRTAIAAAPTAGALRSMPKPVSPTRSTSLAKTGRRPTAPPSSTANKSRLIAPRRIFSRHT